jgi:hypothetical protein
MPVSIALAVWIVGSVVTAVGLQFGFSLADYSAWRRVVVTPVLASTWVLWAPIVIVYALATHRAAR